MKTRLLLILLIGPLPGQLYADEIPSIGSLFDTWDSDKSKSLSKEELPTELQSRMSHLDSDLDGVVTREELTSLPEGMQNRILSMAGEATGKTRGGKGFKKAGEFYAPPAKDEFQKETLKVGDAAPDFTLPRSDGKGTVTLSAELARKPVVLIFGSITCGPFRGKVPQVFALEEKHGDKASFYMVYIREAHPESTIYLEENGEQFLKKFTQTSTLDQRIDNAEYCSALVKTPFPTLVDKEDNAINAAYAGWPNRLIVVGSDGKIAYDGGKGPGGFQPDKLDAFLSKEFKE